MGSTYTHYDSQPVYTYTQENGRVHRRVRAVYNVHGPCRGPYVRPVHGHVKATAGYTTRLHVYMAVYGPCKRP